MDARAMGRKGGSSRSAAKRIAARRNGALGGRPRSVEVFARKVRDMCRDLGPRVPDVDPGNLRLIVRSLLLPPARRVVFVTRRKDGRFVF